MAYRAAAIGGVLALTLSTGIALAGSAVESVNGKVEFKGGFEALNGQAGQAGVSGGASISVPLGDMFGLQTDFAAGTNSGSQLYGASTHLFMRNPDSYLVGIVGGGVWAPNSNSYYIGPEFELYSGNFSLEGVGSVMAQDISGVSSTSLTGKLTAAYYATPGLRFEAGISDVAGYTSAHVGTEWQVADASPLSLTLDGTVGDNSYLGVMGGLKLYFGGRGASLQERHRKFDPPNHSADLISNGGGSAFAKGTCPAGWVTAPQGYAIPGWSGKFPSVDFSLVGGCISQQAFYTINPT
jgi:hypothetical protein